MNKLQYPLNLTTDSDYIDFSYHKYVSNQRVRSGNAASPPRDGYIRLYSPENAPSVANTNNWQRMDFEGPMGRMSSAAARFAGSLGRQGGAEAAANVFGSAKQATLGLSASIAGMTASQLAALKGGEVYNPNVELLYHTPVLRQFSFSFRFLPSSAHEAAAVRNIIRTFKKWSAPEINGQMFNVPHVWQVQYRQPDMMGKFKKAALTTVNVQSNPTSGYHTTFSDGMPVEYSIGLGFMEVDVVTRTDHATGIGT
jgi:hypothetical protein